MTMALPALRWRTARLLAGRLGRALAMVSALGFSNLSLFAQSARPSLGEAQTAWPGVVYQITQVQRIAGDRLLIGVRVLATAQAPAKGTLFGIETPIPPTASKEDILAGWFVPKPFSLRGAAMTDDQTKVEYHTLDPSPTGPQYVSSDCLSTLVPGRSELMSIQFAAPPPPLDDQGHPTKEKQTISILLPKASAPIGKIPIPPPNAP